MDPKDTNDATANDNDTGLPSQSATSPGQSSQEVTVDFDQEAQSPKATSPESAFGAPSQPTPEPRSSVIPPPTPDSSVPGQPGPSPLPPQDASGFGGAHAPLPPIQPTAAPGTPPASTPPQPYDGSAQPLPGAGAGAQPPVGAPSGDQQPAFDPNAAAHQEAPATDKKTIVILGAVAVVLIGAIAVLLFV